MFSKPARIEHRLHLIIVAITLQAIVIAAGWMLTFRYVRTTFATTLEQRVLESNTETVERIADNLIGDMPTNFTFESAEWERAQQSIESLELPGEGFACIIDGAGHLLCHPEIRDDPSLRRVNLADKVVSIDGDEPVRVGDVGETTAAGSMEFVVDGTHYIATKQIPGTDLRVLVHQPQRGLLQVGHDARISVIITSILAAVAVMSLTGVGLFFVVRSYDSVFERVNRRLKRNLLIARDIQQSSYPKQLPSVHGYDIDAWSEPAEETGGDMYDVFERAGQARGVMMLVADAAGHGIGPALSVTQVRSMLRIAARFQSGVLDIARYLNEQLCDDLPDGRFITAWLGILDSDANTLTGFSAGHGPLLLYRASDQTVERIMPDDLPLGVVPTVATTDLNPIQLDPGDLFVVMSDGIIEAADEQNELLGVDRVVEVIRASSDRSASDIISALREAAYAHTGGNPPGDDCTLVVIRRLHT